MSGIVGFFAGSRRRSGGVTLAPLGLSATNFQRGVSQSGVILGARGGSTITTASLPAGLTINSAARTWAWDGSGSGAASGSLSLIETKSGATGSPKTTSIGYAIAAAAVTPTLGALTLSSTSFQRGVTSSGTISGATVGSTINATGLPAGLTIDGAARTWAWSGSGSGAASGSLDLIETLAGATGSPKTSTIGYTIAAAVTGALSALTVPTISGDAVVGQTLYAGNGTYTASPDSYSLQWYMDDGSGLAAMSDFQGDALRIEDIWAGNTFKVGEVAHKSGWTDSAENLSTATAAVAQIAFDAPILTRLSASGDPLEWQLVLSAGSYSGYWLRAEVYPDNTFVDGTQTQDLHYQLTYDDVQPGADLGASLAAAGLTTPGPTEYLIITEYTTSPNGLGYLASSEAITPTDVVTYSTWDPAHKASNINLTNGNKTAARSGGSSNVAVRTTKSHAGKKVYAELTLDTAASGSTFGIIDSTVGTTSQDWTPELFSGGAANPHACAIFPFYGTADFNGVAYNDIIPDCATGDIVCIAHDEPNQKVWFRKVGGTWGPGVGADPATNTGGISLAALTAGATYIGFISGPAEPSATINSGETTWADTAPSGFGAA